MAGTTRPSRVAVVLAAIVIGLATGCRAGLDETLGDYERSVARALGTPEVEAYEPTPLAPPRPRERRLPVESERIGVFDFLSLQGCRLGELAGLRNSPMGRVMEDTRRLAYEIEVRTAADACLIGLEEPRRGRLAALVETKREALPRHLWNATLGGEELESFLSPSPPSALRTGSGLAALREIQRILEAGVDQADDARRLEQALAELTRAEPIGPQLRALDRARHSLEGVARIVLTAPAEACEVPQVRLSRAFQESYLAAVQPAIAAVDQQALPVLMALEEIVGQLIRDVTVPPETRRYLERVLAVSGSDSLWARYRASLRLHAAALEPVLRSCGVLPPIAASTSPGLAASTSQGLVASTRQGLVASTSPARN
ncbi:MAG: DUF3080 family protein [Myxococcota bacterium]|nr:DUF3080 family protein [Myxococcota bacterium]